MKSLILATTMSTLSSSAMGQEPITPKRLWELKRLSDPDLAPKGQEAIVTAQTWGDEDDHFQAELWRVDTSTGKQAKLADGPFSSHGRYSPDGKKVAYLSKVDKEDKAQIYLIPLDGDKKAQKLTAVPDGVTSFKWNPTGSSIVFTTSVQSGLDLNAYAKAKEQEKSEKVTAKEYTGSLTRFWDHWLDDKIETHLYAVNIGTGKITEITSSSGYSLSQFTHQIGSTYDISPDGESFVFSSDTSTDNNFYEDLIYYHRPSNKFLNITEANAASDGQARFGPNGKIVFLQQRLTGFYADKNRIMIYDPSTKKTSQVAAAWDRSPRDIQWHPNGHSLWGTVEDQGQVKVYEILLNSEKVRYKTSTKSYTSLKTNVDGSTMIALEMSLSYPPRLVKFDNLKIQPKAIKIGSFNDKVLGEIQMGRVETVTYKGANGDDIQMWINYPPNFDPEKKWPLYLLLHGGPHNALNDEFHFRWNSQVFAAWGYVVAWHNFHGSSGFGQDFTASILENTRDMPYQDTIEAANFFKNKPWIDKNRMAAGGGSFGGYLASVLQGAKHPFTTLINHAGVYNSFTQIAADYGSSDKYPAEFWDRPDKFLDESPHWHAKNFKTPMLVIHGGKDYRVPVNHGIEIYQTLQKKGIPSKFIYYPDENHWVLKRHNSIHWYNAKKAWLDKYNLTKAPSH